jgi:hypothetical protein
MDVIGHQTITPPAHAIFPEQLQVNLSILVGIENRSPAIAPLCHMIGKPTAITRAILPTNMESPVAARFALRN